MYLYKIIIITAFYVKFHPLIKVGVCATASLLTTLWERKIETLRQNKDPGLIIDETTEN